MSTTDTLFPAGYGLKRVNPQPQYLLGTAVGDISASGYSRVTTFSVRGLMTAAAGTWQTVLDVTNGAGFFNGAALSNATANASAGTSGLRITIDGTAFDVQTTASGNSSLWATPCSISYDSAASMRRIAFEAQQIPYTTSLKVEVLRGSADAFAWAVWHAPEF